MNDYLLNRLAELGVEKLFGVPGDFTLGFVDRVLNHETVDWIGCANELNAGYAADGYARLAGAGAVSVTHGVGELSALNAIAGAYAEEVPLVVISGAPATGLTQPGMDVHHSFADGDVARFSRVFAEVTVASVTLEHGRAADQIDAALQQMLDCGRPVHISVPSDVGGSPATEALNRLTPRRTAPGADEEDAFARALGSAFDRTRPAVLATHLPARLGSRERVRALVREHRLLSATLHRGKGVLDESDPGYAGLYAGEVGDVTARRLMEAAEAVVVLGRFSSGGVVPFRPGISFDKLIQLGRDNATVGGRSFTIPFAAALEVVHETLSRTSDLVDPRQRPSIGNTAETLKDGEPASAPPPLTELDQRTLWDALVASLRGNEILVVESGTSYYAMLERRLGPGVEIVAQGQWSSIGFSLPAALGAASAAPDRRVVLVVGDGSAQVSIQDLGTFSRQGLRATVIVVDNNGYTIERAIHGPDAEYNDIQRWDWSAVPAALGAGDSLVCVASTVEQLVSALEASNEEGAPMHVVVPRLPELDAPDLVRRVAEFVTTRNQYAN